MVQIRQMLVSPKKYGIKCPYAMTPEYITVHNTANDASANNEIQYMINNSSQVSYHIAVDDVEAVQGLPLNRNGWHSGDGNGPGNRKSIGIEICYSKSGGERYRKAEQNAIKLIAQLLKERGWGIERVKKHQDWSGKYCPHRILEEGRWEAFKAEIQRELNGQPAAPVAPSNGNIDVGSIVTVAAHATHYQTGQPIADFVKGRQYKVIQIKDVNQSNSKKAYLLDGIMSWVLEQDIVETGGQAVAPQPQAKKRYIVLPANATSWTVYKPDRPPIKANKANIAGTLRPSKFGGLEYEILEDLGGHVYKIRTGDFGVVKIYGAPSTGARVVEK
ncbi:Phage N-acetylmuramoyl-L-alanine amidase [Caldibacillus thermoamylovorans]|uniref:peptidoglycan recognition protein family protein n=1 Tax=Caldibacillus thermoamylovorans TaxID=35841 RepID=UPI0005A46AC9|nr:N-acetylmuramoyl-L-alanine amidase family protein [Caldibacillus thermoamylovorans]KIO60252.1 Phage N-acetylmuramoyl-L-alanine amidase [Caldibacillus thermoamylovorans]